MVEAWVALQAGLYILTTKAASAELKSALTVKHSSSSTLKCALTVRHSATLELKGKSTIRHAASTMLKTRTVIRHSATVTLPAELIVRHSGSQTLKQKITIRHSSTNQLWGKFYVRTPNPYWTDRRKINGVLQLTQDMMGNARLEDLIEGVMDDIKTRMDSEGVSFSTWTSISSAPRAIIRATTYGVCASLYARSTKTFQSRVIPTIAPVAVTVISDAERAMEFWENKMEEQILAYLDYIANPSILVSTSGEEPVFSMADIPETEGDSGEWRDNFGKEA
jgi:hypothetical protein